MYLLLALHLLNAFGTKLGQLLSSLQARIMFFFGYLHTHMCMHTFLSGTSMVKPTGRPKAIPVLMLQRMPWLWEGRAVLFPTPNLPPPAPQVWGTLPLLSASVHPCCHPGGWWWMSWWEQLPVSVQPGAPRGWWANHKALGCWKFGSKSWLCWLSDEYLERQGLNGAMRLNYALKRRHDSMRVHAKQRCTLILLN